MELVTSRKAARYLRKSIGKAEVEEFWVVALNPLCHVIRASMLFRGTVDTCFVHPRDIFRFALFANASSILIGHNHPSGCCEPSSADEDLTKRIREGGRLLQIPLVDHVIITEKNYFSFAEVRWKDIPQLTLK
jgi:DNA repair protein RadC